MKNILKNQKGFETLTVLGLILILGLVGGIGWYVWNNRNTASESDKSTVVKVDKKETTSDLTKYNNDSLGLEFMYPSNWGEVSIKQGPLLKYQSGDYDQLSFSSQPKVAINLVNGPYSSPLDACGYDDAVKNAQHQFYSYDSNVVGWTPDYIKQYYTGQGFNKPSMYKFQRVASDQTGNGWDLVRENKDVLVWKQKKNSNTLVEPTTDDQVCKPVTQTQANQANSYLDYYHYSLNKSVKGITGINARMDVRENIDEKLGVRLETVLNSIK